MKELVSEYISTRICHDIIGNIGAVANAVELLEEGDLDFMDDIKSILKTSSSVLTARMKFFRIAFGLSNAQINNVIELENIIKNYLKTVGGKTPPELDCNINECKTCKAILLLAMIMADIMIKGGTIHINTQNDKIIVGIDETVRIAEDKFNHLLEIMRGNYNQVSAQDAPLLYMLELCKKEELRIEYATSPVLCFVVG